MKLKYVALYLAIATCALFYQNTFMRSGQTATVVTLPKPTTQVKRSAEQSSEPQKEPAPSPQAPNTNRDQETIGREFLNEAEEVKNTQPEKEKTEPEKVVDSLGFEFTPTEKQITKPLYELLKDWKNATLYYPGLAIGGIAGAAMGVKDYAIALKEYWSPSKQTKDILEVIQGEVNTIISGLNPSIEFLTSYELNKPETLMDTLNKTLTSLENLCEVAINSPLEFYKDTKVPNNIFQQNKDRVNLLITKIKEFQEKIKAKNLDTKDETIKAIIYGNVQNFKTHLQNLQEDDRTTIKYIDGIIGESFWSLRKLITLSGIGAASLIGAKVYFNK